MDASTHQPISTPYTPSQGVLARLRRRIAFEWPIAPINVERPGGLISFSFDDFPKSSAQAGADILENAAARGTYYASWKLLGVDNHQGMHADFSDVMKLAGNGHEIGCHSYSHVDFTSLPAADQKAQLELNAAAFAEAGLPTQLQSFAYPFGAYSIDAKRLAASRFGSARSATQGMNSGIADLYSLRAVPLEIRRKDMLDRAKRMIDAAVRKGGWIIFYTHDVRDACSDYGLKPAMFDEIVSASKASGAQILPVAKAALLADAVHAGAVQ